jgi:hypothetical protein
MNVHLAVVPHWELADRYMWCRNVIGWALYYSDRGIKFSVWVPIIIDMQSFFFFLFYSGSSQLEHRASVKHFVSLQFLNLRQSIGPLGRGISPSQGRYLTQTQNKHNQTSMHWVAFEPTIPVSERAKTFHALDRATSVIDTWNSE